MFRLIIGAEASEKQRDEVRRVIQSAKQRDIN